MIGDLKLKSRLILAPMAGISDLPFRLLNRRFGAELAFVEMINARSISHKSRRTRAMLSTCAEDRPLGIQLLGSEEEYIRKALEVLKGYKFDLLDFNAACPAKKVVRRGEGASLLKDPRKLNRLLKLIVKRSKVPVTVKMRIGWDKDSINAREVALYAEDAGISGIFVHGRTRTQGYGGSVDYKSIKEVKKSVSIPVIASGDIFSEELMKKMFEETGADGLAVARGALGNPWIFRDRKPGLPELIRTMTGHLQSCVDFYGEKRGVIIWRKFFGWYTKGLRRVRPLRERSSRARTAKEMLSIIGLTDVG
jgi:tRNA-dihydrouridine synthase B